MAVVSAKPVGVWWIILSVSLAVEARQGSNKLASSEKLRARLPSQRHRPNVKGHMRKDLSLSEVKKRSIQRPDCDSGFYENRRRALCKPTSAASSRPLCLEGNASPETLSSVKNSRGISRDISRVDIYSKGVSRAALTDYEHLNRVMDRGSMSLFNNDKASVLALMVATTATLGVVLAANAAREGGGLDILNFNPVCPAADGLFRLGQRAAVTVAGDQNVDDYRPLINDVLIRVRTEICVLESFARETALPFIQKKGLGWILPARESSETYVAGVVFVVGANFILLGSTKVLAILAIYHDILLGLPSRAIGGTLDLIAKGGNSAERDEKQLKKIMDEQFKEVKKIMKSNPNDSAEQVTKVNAKFADKIEKMRADQAQRREKAKEKGLGQAQKVAGGVAFPLRAYGQVSLGAKRILEAFDTFCSRYLVATTVLYTLIKSVHFWILKDFP
mmetsp:Transcript_12955/g.20777  ORF Transcript_12955/g.20777 Transcript_12955/m.20777 type:complete len:448 (-) Transcript_12955:238-1581(-)